MKTLSQSPTDPAFVQDPYPFYARARATGPLVFWSDYAMPVATTHAAVNALLRDRRFGREPVTPREIPDHLAPSTRSRRIPCWSWSRRATRGCARSSCAPSPTGGSRRWRPRSGR
jgi:cytochrome P450